MEHETDFCDRIPGCHTGRLSLELQGREMAEWQRRIADLECRLIRMRQQNLRRGIVKQMMTIADLSTNSE